MRAASFNPLLYSAPVSYPPINYNRTVKVDIGKFDKLCKKFRDIPHEKIKHLRGRDREDFNLVVSYIHLLASDEDYYKFYDKVTQHFYDLKEVAPGTVGSYFAGCLVNTPFSSDKPGCSAVCAGSIPKPKDEEGWSFCDNTVIFAEKVNRKYEFTILKESDSDLSYIFVEETNLEDFEGFSKQEKEKLSKMGVFNVHLVGCDEKGTKYVDLDQCGVFDIKERQKSEFVSDNSRLAIAVVLIVVIILLILFFFGWRFWDQNGNAIPW